MKTTLAAVLGIALALVAARADATFHTFRISQLYSNADGTVQFVVLRESAGANGENQWAGHALRATAPGVSRTYTFPSNLPDDTTSGRAVLVGTVGFAALGLVRPDFVVPNGFLPLADGSLDFAGVDAVSYASLPTDGTTALSRAGVPVANVATNFDGESASIRPGAPAAANHQGLWYRSPAESESGWGLNVAHQGDVIFATWFTYDASGAAWWLSTTAAKQPDGSFAGALAQTRGPAFAASPFDPAKVVRTDVGTASLRFGDSDNGTFSYTVNGVSQSKPITRQKFGTPPACAFGLYADLGLATNYQDLWWAAPAASESGWGLNVTHQGAVLFVTWFTYDESGAPTWLSGTLRASASGPLPPPTPAPYNPYEPAATAAVPDVFAGTLVRTRGPAFSSVPFDPSAVSRSDAGTATLTFTGGNSGTFAYAVNGVSQAKPIVRQVFRPPGTACR